MSNDRKPSKMERVFDAAAALFSTAAAAAQAIQERLQERDDVRRATHQSLAAAHAASLSGPMCQKINRDHGVSSV